MPPSPLYKEFMAALQSSMLFRALGGKEKAFLIASYKDASEEQLRKSMDLLERDDADMKTTVIKRREQDERESPRQFADVSARYAELKKITMKEENEKEVKESSKKADELLAKIGTIKAEPQKKAKKLFGLF
jgi:hypothetical protein